MSRQRTSLALILLVVCTASARPDAMDRLQKAKIEETHKAVVELQSKRQDVPIDSGYEDTRAVMHCHSHWSHDSNSPIEEIIAAAKEVGVKVVMFTEHPADSYDYFTDGNSGVMDGILLIPGAETSGQHIYPRASIQSLQADSPQEVSDLSRRTGGLSFMLHLEERMDWVIAGGTGAEMYNTHADVKEEQRLYLGLANPLLWLTLRPLLEQYPQEVFAILQDYPRDYLRRFDELCQMFPHTGIAGNDSHHNIGVRVIRGEEDLIRIEDALGKKLAEIRISQFPFLAILAGKAETGDVILEIDLDPYERSFRHVSTHLYLKEFSQEGVWDALESGRCYVAFDWICDPTGFVFFAQEGEGDDANRFPTGAKIPFTNGLKLRAAAPLQGDFRLIRNGEQLQSSQGSETTFDVQEPGVYRVEVWVTVGPEDRVWILSNPIYIREPK